MGTWFDTTHVIYIVISLLVTVLILSLAKRFLHKDLARNRFLKTFALLTFFLHISILWVDYLSNGSATVADNILFPKYFCNLSMYMLVITAFWENRTSKTYRFFAIMTAYGGFFGAMISLIYPEYYFGHSIAEWQVLKSMLSHSTMLVGSIWIIIGGFIPVKRSNTLVYGAGLVVYWVIGEALNWLFKVNGLPDPNAMYLSAPPLAEAPFLNAYVIGLLMLLVIFGFTWWWEKREQRSQIPTHTPSHASAVSG